MDIFHLSPRGSDKAPGTASRPWATLEGARNNLRRLRASGRIAEGATVRLASGRYPLRTPVAFGPEDSATTYAAAPGAKPVIDGGEPITGWKVGRRNGRVEWTVDLPEVAAGSWYFRSLFVNGRRAPRARLPKFSPDSKGVKNVFRIQEITAKSFTGLFEGSDTFKPKPGDVADWPSLGDAEAVLLHYWIEERMPRPRLNPRTGWLQFARRSSFILYEAYEAVAGSAVYARYYIDNLFEALTEPGEWYLNRETGRLYYLPRPGETPQNTTIVAPRVLAGLLFDDTGDPLDPFATRHVRNLSFKGLSFRHSDWYSPLVALPAHHAKFGVDTALAGNPQAAIFVPGSVSFRAARDCTFEDCAIEHAGLYGLEFGEGCRQCSAVGNEIHDMGAGGIRAHGRELDERIEGRTGHLRITDNRIGHIGRVFHQGIGILLGHAFDCTVAHNHIHDTCYTAISVGWNWGYKETVSRNNRIENNLIHDIGAGVLSDMGGIYTLGVQPGTVIRGNHIHHIHSHDYGGWGIYLDEGTSHLVVEHNLVHDTKDAAFNIHYARENVVRHNIFARGHHSLVSVFRIEPGHFSATLLNNIILGPSQKLYAGGYQGDILRGALVCAANCIWFPGGRLAPSGNPKTRKDGVPHRISFAQWRKAGHDRSSIVADPKVREGRRTWTVAPSSPALRLGFAPFDWSGSGPRPRDKPT
jgi:Right handed beta helix region